MSDTKVGSRAPVRSWLYLCAGMRRSGSTLQAQLVANLLSNRPLKVSNPDEIRSLINDGVAPEGASVFKCHAPTPEVAPLLLDGQAKVFYVFRDIRDVVASICKKYSLPPFSFIHGGAAAIMCEYRAWSSMPGIYVARYELMQQDLAGEILRMADYLDLRVSKVEADSIAAEFGLERQKERIRLAFANEGVASGRGENEYDPSTLMHRNHISSGEVGGFRSVLKPHEIAALEWVLRKWMRETGYAPDYAQVLQALAYGWFALRSRANAFRRYFRPDPPKEHSADPGAHRNRHDSR